jgi:hypothetical protein
VDCRTPDWKIVDDFEAETDTDAARRADVYIKLAYDSVPRDRFKVSKETTDGWEPFDLPSLP